MKRRAFLATFAATTLESTIARAQQSSNKIPRIGILSPAENEATPIFEAFRRGLRELGYVEGRNIILEYRFAHGDNTVLRRLAEELPKLPVDIILADSSASAQAAAGATRTIPIVMGASSDPVALGLADSLARPGGNVTGFTGMLPELGAKRVDLMRTAFPDATALTVLLNPSQSSSSALFRITEELARSLGLTVTRVEKRSFEPAARFSCCRTRCSGTIAARSSNSSRRRASPHFTQNGNTLMTAV
jgi:putative tryptophan/tyrosine transport system substrate-binding protein